MSLSLNFSSVTPTLRLDFAQSKRLDPRITFTRASTATYYNGVTTAKAEENLLLQSQNWTATWSTPNITATADQTTAPDATTTADQMTATANTSFHQVEQPITVNASTTYVFSVFAKAGTHQFVYFGIQARLSGVYVNNPCLVAYNLSTQTTVGTTSGTFSISSVGSSWYRIVLTATVASSGVNQFAGFVGFADSSGNQNITLAGTETFFLWGAQFEQRSAVTAYTATTTQAITNYIPVLQTAAADAARFDHNPTTGVSLGLLIEEQRTNLLTYSDDFSNAAWTNSNYTLTSNTIVAPDGTLTGDKLAANTGSSLKAVTRTSAVSITAGTVYTASVYVKNSGVQFVSFTFDDNTTTSGVTTSFDLTNGTISRAAVAYGTGASASSSITSVGNSWYRITITGTAGTTSVLGRWAVAIQTTGTTQFANYTGNGFDGIYIWGAQLETGAFATSYISTVAAQVTRSADNAIMTGTNFSSWYNQSEGTFVRRVLAYSNSLIASPNEKLMTQVTDGTANNYMALRFVSDLSTPYADSIGITSSVTQFDLSNVTFTNNTYVQQALAYASNNVAQVVNAGSASTDTSVTLPVVNTINLFYQSGCGYISRLFYYPSRLTNAQLQALTS